MNSYPIMSLATAGVAVLDCEHKTPRATSEGKPYIAIPNVREGKLDLTNVRFISLSDYQVWTRRTKPQVDDIVLTRRARVGDTAVIPPGLDCALGQNLVILRSEGSIIGQPFLRWLVRGPEYWDQVYKYQNEGAVFSSLNVRDISKFQLSVPPLSIQRRIAEILGRLDDKIEVNRRINRTLERMAQALYKHWFVDFRPFQDGEFVESELGLVPEGCEVVTLDDLVEIEANIINPQKHADEVFDHYSIPAYDERNLPVAEPGAAVKSGKYLIQSDRVLVSKLNPTNHRVWTVYAPQGRRSFSSTEFIHYVCRTPVSWSFVNGYVRSQAFVDELRSHVSGTTGSRQRVPPRVTMSFMLMKPPANVLAEFDRLAGPYLRLIQRNLEENQTLAKTRDYLLPRLLTGEVEV